MNATPMHACATPMSAYNADCVGRMIFVGGGAHSGLVKTIVRKRYSLFEELHQSIRGLPGEWAAGERDRLHAAFPAKALFEFDTEAVR